MAAKDGGGDPRRHVEISGSLTTGMEGETPGDMQRLAGFIAAKDREGEGPGDM